MNRAARRWLARVERDRRIDRTTALVARALAEHTDGDGHVKATDEQIARWVEEIAARDGAK